jgi:ribosome-associated toxin RatA of RatAB toxin-antitoxin module
VVDAPPELIWRAMLDTDAYHHFVPATETSRLVDEGENQRTIEIVHEHGPVRARYFLRVTFDSRTRSAQFRVDSTRPRDIREGWGFFVVRPFGGARSLVTFAVMVDVGSGLATGLVRPRVHHWMMQMPAELKRYVEGWGRSRYE